MKLVEVSKLLWPSYACTDFFFNLLAKHVRASLICALEIVYINKGQRIEC